jgi:hypothetical protein
MISFHKCHIVHIRAQTPTLIWPLTLLFSPSDQFINKLFMFLRGDLPKDIWTIPPNSFASVQSMNKCWVYCFLFGQKQHFVFPYQFLLIRFSFVNITFLCKNNMKILIFSDTVIFHMYLRKSTVWDPGAKRTPVVSPTMLAALAVLVGPTWGVM